MAALVISHASTATGSPKIGATQWNAALLYSGELPVVNGGTGGADAATARSNLGVPAAANGTHTGTTTVQTLSASGTISAVAVVASATNGVAISNYFPDGSNYATQCLSTDPATSQPMALQGYHVPGTWFGYRMVLGSVSPGVIEFRAQGGGTIVANGTALTSDIRVKTDLQPISDALDKVSRLRGFTYLRTDIADENRHMSLIAQDVQAVAPEAVLELGGPDNILAVKGQGVEALLVEAIKELRAEVERLKAEQK